VLDDSSQDTHFPSFFKVIGFPVWRRPITINEDKLLLINEDKLLLINEVNSDYWISYVIKRVRR
jgi:hypothetical protein